MTATFRAATLNIWGSNGPWPARLESIRHGVMELAPDILGMQEVARNADLDQAALIADGLGYHIAWGQAHEGSGNAILSRWPIRSTQTFPLPDCRTSERRSVIFAEIEAPFGTLPVFCTHLNWMLHHGHVRQRQVRALTDFVSRLASEKGFPGLVMGDFNAEPDSDEIRFMRGHSSLGGECVCYADCFADVGDGTRGATFSKTNPFANKAREPERRIDYIFLHRPWAGPAGEPLGANVCFNQPHNGTFPTDHFGVTATIATGS